MLALMLQLVASFGHIHAREFAAAGLSAGGHASSALPAKTPARTALSKSKQAADDDELCPICLAGLLLANSHVPASSQPIVLVVAGEVDYGSLRVFQAPGDVPSSYRSRAPPRLTSI